MDFHGNILTSCKYEKIGEFADGNLAYVILNDKVGYIDSNGKEIISPIYDRSRALPQTGMCFIKKAFAIW